MVPFWGRVRRAGGVPVQAPSLPNGTSQSMPRLVEGEAKACAVMSFCLANTFKRIAARSMTVPSEPSRGMASHEADCDQRAAGVWAWVGTHAPKHECCTRWVDKVSSLAILLWSPLELTLSEGEGGGGGGRAAGRMVELWGRG